MARTHARVFVSIWRDEDFTRRSAAAQRTYIMLLSQADLSYCGVIPYRPKRWAILAADLIVDDVEQDVDELEDAGMVVRDRVTDELWIRSFVKHDGITDSPNMKRAARAAYENVMSEDIRKAFADAYPNVFVDDPKKGSEKASGKGSRKGSTKASEKGLSDSVGRGERGKGDLLQTSTNKVVPSTKASAPPDTPIVADLVAHYVEQYRMTHRNFEPPRAFRSACGQQCKRLLAEGYSPDDLRKCLNAIASENRQPANLALTLADLHLAAS